jgi:epsilon-lactone hydrolase
VALRRAFARWLVRRVVRPGIAPGRPLERRRRHVERSARLLPLPRDVRRVPAGAENPGGEWWLPRGVEADSPRGAVLYVHGGGFMLGSPVSHRGVAARLARCTGLPVLAAHYRLAPEHAYPAALEDLQPAWRRITLGGARPAALAGDSAGGWLALALALHAAAAGLPRPTAAALFSPLVDLAGAARIWPAAADLMLPPGFVAESVAAWRGDIPAGDPRLDLLGAPLAGLPPLFISYDRDEMLAGDARRLAQAAQAAGVQVRVEQGHGLWHAWPLLAGLLLEADATLRHAATLLVPAGLRAAPA